LLLKWYIYPGSFFAGDAASVWQICWQFFIDNAGYVNTMANAPSVYDPLAGQEYF
jgi:hypothetical protein